MKPEISAETEIEIDEYEDYQYEESTEMADQFVDEEIIPLLAKFDYDNPEEDYVPGVATFNLYTKLVNILIQEGFEAETLKEVIDEFALMCIDDTVH
jgi:hypothetical protein